MTARTPVERRHPHTSRKDLHMHHIELRLADVHERQALMRTIRHADRSSVVTGRSVRRRVGESLVRLGRRVGGDTGDAMARPAWQG
jgi:hypothetical protein